MATASLCIPRASLNQGRTEAGKYPSVIIPQRDNSEVYSRSLPGHPGNAQVPAVVTCLLTQALRAVLSSWSPSLLSGLTSRIRLAPKPWGAQGRGPAMPSAGHCSVLCLHSISHHDMILHMYVYIMSPNRGQALRANLWSLLSPVSTTMPGTQ